MNQAQREFSRFIISGIFAVLTDMLIYYILSNFIDISVAKAISFLSSTITAYIMNKYYTFEKKEKSAAEVIKFFSLYFFSLCANIFVNKLSLTLTLDVSEYVNISVDYQIIKLFAFLAATATSTIINFTAMKFWIFKLKGGQ